MKAIRSNTVITSLRALVDGSLSMTVHTPELSPEEKVAFMSLQNVNLIADFVPNDDINAPKIKVDKEINSKTPGQRLRAVIFILWKQNGQKGDFEDYYRSRMENLIEVIKGKLD